MSRHKDPRPPMLVRHTTSDESLPYEMSEAHHEHVVLGFSPVYYDVVQVTEKCPVCYPATYAAHHSRHAMPYSLNIDMLKSVKADLALARQIHEISNLNGFFNERAPE